jgi:chromosome segregation ATPase
MEPTDLTIEILQGIRAEARNTNAAIAEVRDEARKTNAAIGQTNERLDRLEQRQTSSEMRLASEIVALVGAVREVRDLLREDRGLHDRVDDHERRLSALEQHTR